MNRIERLERIKEVINNWDPIGLLAMESPQNEYDLEITKISSKIKLDNDVEKLTEIIQQVFTEMFDSETFNKTIEECRKVAKEILK